MTQLSRHPVPDHRVADGLTHDETHPGSLPLFQGGRTVGCSALVLVVGFSDGIAGSPGLHGRFGIHRPARQCVQHETWPARSTSTTYDPGEILAAPEPRCRWKHGPPRSGGQTLTAPAAPGGHDGAAGPGVHPLPETMRPGPFAVVRLVGALALAHGRLSRLLQANHAPYKAQDGRCGSVKCPRAGKRKRLWSFIRGRRTHSGRTRTIPCGRTRLGAGSDFATDTTIERPHYSGRPNEGTYSNAEPRSRGAGQRGDRRRDQDSAGDFRTRSRPPPRAGGAPRTPPTVTGLRLCRTFGRAVDNSVDTSFPPCRTQVIRPGTGRAELTNPPPGHPESHGNEGRGAQRCRTTKPISAGSGTRWCTSCHRERSHPNNARGCA